MDKDEEMKKRIQHMATKTWNVIGGDALRSLEEAGEKPVMPRSHVVEMVCDAEYMSMYGGDKEAYTVFAQLGYPEKLKIVSKAFLLPRYGM